MAYTIHTTQSWAQTLDDLAETFAKWGVRDWSVRPMQTDSRKRWWGEEERRVTVTFTRPGAGEQRVSLATQGRPVDNLRAIYLGLEAMRLNERRGIGELVRELYLQLPAPATERDPWEVLGVRPDTDLADIEAVYRSKAKRLHPDAGGSAVEMAALNQAWERVKSERNGNGRREP